MIRIRTEDVFAGKRNRPLDMMEKLWVYNGIDSAITLEIYDVIKPQLDEFTAPTYAFERAQRAPALDMMRRGIRIDLVKRQRLLASAKTAAAKVNDDLQTYSYALWDREVNFASYPQVKKLFYEFMGLPEQKIWNTQKREMTVSVNRDSLEKLLLYLPAVPFIRNILWLRENKKRQQVLECRLDSDGRIRTSLNVGATETGRWSSSKNVFGTGDNLQNIEHEGRKGFEDRALRSMFIPDKGYKMAYADLEQAESREVAYLSKDDNYIRAHEEGDPHTMVAGMVFGLLLTGDKKSDRALVDQSYYRHFSYRDMAKRCGHMTNYFAKPSTLVRQLKINEEVAREFQRAYFSAFPGIREWHNKIIYEIQTKGYLITPLGRRRHFLADTRSDETVKEAIAYQPQSMIADVLNAGLCKVYQAYKEGLSVQLLLQVHDAILFQFPEGSDPEIIPQVLHLMEVPHEVEEHKVVIPVACETGYDWHNLKDWEENTNAVRPRVESILDQRVSSVK